MYSLGPALARTTLWSCALVLGGCEQILDIPNNPQLVVEAGTAQADGPWSCLGLTTLPPRPSSATATVKVRACSFVSANCEQSAAVTASLCNKRDVTCDLPLQTGIQSKDGVLSVEIPTGGPEGTGFDGYLKVDSEQARCDDRDVFGESASMLCGLLPECDPSAPQDDRCNFPIYAPGLLFFNPPVVADATDPIVLPLTPVASFGPLLEAAGQVFDPTTGSVFITALDCDHQLAAGVRYEIGKFGDLVTPLYVDNGVISDGAMATDPSGMGGFLGVPAGFNTVAGKVSIEGNEVATGESGVYVAPFTVSYTTLTPSF